MTKRVAPSRTTHQNTTDQPDATRLKVLKICVITVMNTSPRIATNKHSRKDTTKISRLKAHSSDLYQATNETADRRGIFGDQSSSIEAQKSIDSRFSPGPQNAALVQLVAGGGEGL